MYTNDTALCNTGDSKLQLERVMNREEYLCQNLSNLELKVNSSKKFLW